MFVPNSNLTMRITAILGMGLAVAAIVTFLTAPSWRWSEHLLACGALCSLPLGILLLQARPSKRNLPAGIQRQLTAISESSQQLSEILAPIQHESDSALGWNRLVEYFSTSSALQAIEHRLENLSSSDQSQADIEILNSLADGIAVTDLEGRLIFMNQALEVILGLESQEQISDSFQDYLPQDLPEKTRAAIQTQLPVYFDSESTSEDGEAFIRWTRRPSLDEKGMPQSHVWTVRDVSQQKMAEGMREEFVAMATHELRTPLANINAYAETLMMADDISSEDQKSFFNIIHSEATRLSRFIDELLDVSRMEAGSMSIVRKEVDLMRLLKEVCDKVRPDIDHKQQEFEVTLPPKLPNMSLDKDAFSAALINLLGNASKYSPEEGSIHFEVSLIGQEIRFQVNDTGIGIAPDELPNVFKKFYRSDDDRVRDITGSGLGLAFTHEVVRLHGGHIDASSELNKGSEFCIVLPAEEEGAGS